MHSVLSIGISSIQFAYMNSAILPAMVFIEDREGIFDAPIDKVWKLAKAHSSEDSKIHPSVKNIETTMLDDNTFINSCTKTSKSKL